VFLLPVWQNKNYYYKQVIITGQYQTSDACRWNRSAVAEPDFPAERAMLHTRGREAEVVLPAKREGRSAVKL